MTEVFEHNPGDHEDPLTGPTWIIGFLGAVLLAVIMLGLTALLYNAMAEEEQRKVIEREPEQLRNLRNRQLAHLTVATPRWVQDPPPAVEPGEEPLPAPPPRLVIPLEQAMQLVVHEYGGAGQTPGDQR